MKILLCIIVFLLCKYSEGQVGLIYTSLETDDGWGAKEIVAFNTHQYYFPNVTFLYMYTVYDVTACLNVVNTLYSQSVRLIFIGDYFPSCAQQATLLHSDLYVLNYDVTLYPDYPRVSAIDDLTWAIASRYASGAFAAKQLGSNQVCMLMPGGFLTSTLLANMIIQGITQALPKKDWKLFVGYTNSFNDPVSEEAKINALASAGCKIFITHQNTMRPQVLIKQKGLFSIPWSTDNSHLVDINPNDIPSVLTSNIMTPLQTQRAIITTFLETGNVVNKMYTVTFDNGFSFAPFSSNVKKSAASLFDNVLAGLIAEQINPFCGPLVQESFGVQCSNETALSSNFLKGVTIV